MCIAMFHNSILHTTLLDLVFDFWIFINYKYLEIYLSRYVGILVCFIRLHVNHAKNGNSNSQNFFRYLIHSPCL